MKNLDTLRRRITILLLVVLCPALPAFGQQDPDPDPGPPIPPDAAVPGEEVTSLPILAGSEGAGFRLSGSIADLHSVLLAVEGRGRIDVSSAGDGSFQLHFRGSFAVKLDPAYLAGQRVRLAFEARTALPGGTARIGVNPARTIDLALADLNAGIDLPVGTLIDLDGFQGLGVFVEATHPDLGFVRAGVDVQPTEITLYQLSGGI